MNYKHCIVAALLLLSVINLDAQSRRNYDREVISEEKDDYYQFNDEEELSDFERTAVRTTWLANSPESNWFLTLQGGLSYLGSENFREIAFMDNLAFSGGFQIGKWFSPVWGLATHFSTSRPKSFASKGGMWYIGQNYKDPNGNYSPIAYVNGTNYPEFIEERFLNDATPYVTTSGKNAYLYKFTYATFGLDFLVNIRNLTSIYDPNAFFNPVIYGGLGYYHTFAEGQRTAVNGILERFGLQFNFKASNSIDLNLTFEDLMIPEVFDRQVGGNLSQDHVLSASLGITLYFGGGNTFTKAFPNASSSRVIEKNDYVEKTKTTQTRVPARYRQEKENNIDCEPVMPPRKSERRRYNPFVDDPEHDNKAKRPETVKIFPQNEVMVLGQNDPFELSPVFFEIGSSTVRESEMPSIAKAANYLELFPLATLEIMAFSDKETGDPQTNLVLSEKRAKAVYAVLVKKFGGDRERITLSYYGDRIQPFKTNNKNRAVLFVK